RRGNSVQTTAATSRCADRAWEVCALAYRGAVTLRTASVATPGRVTAILIGVPRLRARCAATRQRGLQKRAVERCGLNCEPQAKQVALMPPARRVRALP